MAIDPNKLSTWTGRLQNGDVDVDVNPRGVCIKVFYRRRPAWIAAGVLTVIALVFVRDIYYDNNLSYQVSAMEIVVMLGLLLVAVVSILPHPIEPTTFLASPGGLEWRGQLPRASRGFARSWPRDRIEDIFVRPWNDRRKRRESLELGLRLTDGSELLLGFATPEEAEVMTEALRRGLCLEAPLPKEQEEPAPAPARPPMPSTPST